MMKKKQKKFVINIDYFFHVYKLMHSMYKKYFNSDFDIKTVTLEAWKKIMVSFSDYCKKHNCPDEFKW